MARPRAPRVVGRILKTIAAAVIVTVCVLVGWRMCTSGDPKQVKVVAANETLAEAYRNAGGDLNAYRQEQASITRAPDSYGYFSVTRCVFFPEAGQVQLVLRYNKSTLRHLAEDKGLDAVPPKDGTHFDVTLVRTTDRTPDNSTDNLDPDALDQTRFHATGDPVRVETSLYTYLRYTFDGVDVLPDTVGVFVDVYWLGDLDYTARPYGTLCLWDNASENIPYRLTRADREALEAFGKP